MSGDPVPAPGGAGAIPAVVSRPRRGGVPGAVVAWSIAALVPALWAITLMGREWSRPPAAVVVLVAFLPYLYVAVAALAFAVWCALPDRGVLPAAWALLLLTGFGLWGPSLQGGATSAGDMTVMSWNVRRLWGGPGAVGRPDEVAAATRCVEETIREQDPDVLTLMEVTRQDVAVLEAALGMTCAQTDYFGVGRSDLAGLAACVRKDTTLRSAKPLRFVQDEAWNYVFTEIERGGRVFNVLAVHLYPYGLSTGALRKTENDVDEAQAVSLLAIGRHGEQTFRAQVHQSDALIRATETLHDPTVIAGDFNSTPDSALHQALRRTLRDAWSGGRGFGGTVDAFGWVPLRIDYVYTTDDFSVRRTEVLPSACSDHRPVVTRLVFQGG